jgi:hypothetical protein
MSKSRSGGPGGSSGPSADFAETLGALVQSHDSSARDLAAALGIDVSLIYKWLRRERTPALASEYAEAIARFLVLDTAERAALRAAQEHSLTQGRPKQSVPRRVVSLIGRIVTRESDDPAAEWSSATRTTPALAPKWPVIHSQEDLQQAVLNLIGGALKPKTPDAAILCTFQSDGRGAFDGDRGARWQDAMQRALRNGWYIEHVWRLNRDVERSVSLVASTLDLLGDTKYRPLYIDGAETLSPPYDLVIRPDVAMVMLATHNAHNVDAAIVTRGKEQIRVWREHYMQLSALAQPPLQRFLPPQSGQFVQLLADSEERLPGRGFVKYGLSLFTEPSSWSRPDSHWAHLIDLQGFDVDLFLVCRQRRLVAFQRHVQTAVYRDICPQQAVEIMVQSGLYLADGNREPRVQVPPQARREHLANTIHVLREQANFHLALVPDDVLARVRISPDTFWEVSGGVQAMLNTPTRGGSEHAAAMNVVITEPRIAAAFQVYFDSLWERIPPLNRDKRYVIWWLERQLERLQD